MTETEQQRLGPSLQPGQIAANIARDAQENLAGLEVVSVGPMYAEQVPGAVRYGVVVIVPERGGKDFVVKTPISTTTKPPSRLNGRGHIP